MLRLLIIIILLLIFGIYTILDVVISLILLPFRKNSKLSKNLENYSFAVRKLFVDAVLFISGTEIKVKGTGNIESLKDIDKILIVSNHRGIFDILAGIKVLNRNIVFVAKKEMKKAPIINYWMVKTKSIFLDRKDLRSGAMMVLNAINMINEGMPVWIFPEGTRNKNTDPKELLEFKSGAFKIAEKSDSYILPIGFANTENVFESHKPFVKKTTIYMSIGKAYKISEIDWDLDIGEYNKNLVSNLIKDINI